MSHPLCYTIRMKEIKNMKLKMKLTKSEQEFIAENITKFDVVTGITVDEFEVRVHGATLNAEGKETSVQSAAVYRTNDIKAIYMNAADKAKMIEENIAALRKRQNTVGTVAWKRAHSRMV